MADLVLFKTQDYKVAAKSTDVLLTLNKGENETNRLKKVRWSNRIKDINPLNSQEIDATQLIYFDGEHQLECIAVSEVTYVEGFQEDDVVYFMGNENQDGIIGFINKDEDIIPIIDIPNFSYRWLQG
ncbi:hypothetical protein R9X47_15765 [Wukongibacter baidiensis]|uniref:hypothetical protein n=1 Tax=Wukongibacter baidiensis TaxID=1723361 RepID=UPI003D7FE1BF